jgi:hypothetical protein
MWDFLQWVYWQCLKVYYWFSDYFWEWVDRVVNFYQKLSELWAQWWRSITDYVTNFITAMIKAVAQYINDVRNYLESLAYSLMNSVINTLYVVRDWLLAKINEAVNTAYNLYNAAINFISAVRDNLISLLYSIRQNLIDLFNNALQPFRDIYGYLITLINFFTVNALNRLSLLLYNLYTQAVEVLQDPQRWVIQTLESIILHLLDYVIGKALGTILYDLEDKDIVTYVRERL